MSEMPGSSGPSGGSWEHAAEARAALSEIVNDPQHGVAALSNGPTMSNLLKDLLPDAPREKSILVAAAEAGVADALREHIQQGMDSATATRLVASSLAASTPFTPEACSWVASEIAIALGISPTGAAAGGGPASPGTAQDMPTQVAQIPGYQPGQQDTVQPAAAGAGPTVPGPGQQGGWQQPAQPGWQQPAQPGWQQPAQPGWQQPAQQGWQPAQPGWQQPGQPGWQPGGPVSPRRGNKGWFIAGGSVIGLVVLIVVGAIVANGTKSSSSHTRGSGGTGSHSPTPTPPPTSAAVAPLATIMRPIGHGAVGSSCSDTSSTNKQNLDPATLTAATFCTSTFTPYTNIHVWGYQFDNYTDFQTGVTKLNSWTGYTGGGSLNTTCPPGSSARGRTEWWALHNAMYTSHRQDQFLECFTDHVKSAGNAGRAFLIWTLPTQDVIFIAENTVGNTSTNFTYLVNWWKHVAYA